MAPADFSPAGSSSYSSDTLVVGDGTWDFTKNTFLLPNLMALNFDTMQYNGKCRTPAGARLSSSLTRRSGMGNRFSTIAQYHSIVTAHGVLAAIVFLFIVPAAIFIVRFYSRRPGFAIQYHAYLQILTVGLTTIVFILGWFAVGPARSLTNPHHGIGVAIYVLILLQAIGGRMVKHITHRSIRLKVHRWSGRAVALLGIVQIPLGLTLYGSPKFTFVLFTIWMTFLLVLYFFLDYREERWRDRHGEGGRVAHRGRSSERKESGGKMKWLGPLAAGAGAFALLRGRRKSRSRSRDGSRSRARSRSRSRPPEVIPSRRGSESYVSEKYSEHRRSGGGFMGKLATAGAAVGAGALLSRFMGRKKDRSEASEYSAVATDTPSRRSRLHRNRPPRYGAAMSEYSDETEYRSGRRSPLLPGPGGTTAAAAAISAAASRPGAHGQRPTTPRPSHPRHDSSRVETISDYSSYESPSHRTPGKSGGAGKGILAAVGLGWLAKRMSGSSKRNREEEESLRTEDEERRSGIRPSRYTGDGYGSPARRDSRRRVGRRPPPVGGTTVSAVSDMSSSVIEPRPQGSMYGGAGPPMPPLMAPGGAPVTPAHQSSRSRSRSRHDVEPAMMPAMPPDPQGILHRDSGSETYMSSGGGPQRRPSERRRRAGEAAAAAAVASASRLAAEEEGRRRGGRSGDNTPPSQPVSVKVKMHDDRDRNVTLRRLTEEEAAASRRAQGGRRRADSASSLSEAESPTRRRYRRDSSLRRDELRAERMVDDVVPAPPAPLSPPNPAFAAGRRPKDSAYYSGQPGPSGGLAAAGHTVSSIGSPDSHGTWSAMSPSPRAGDVTGSAADRRRRRRLERRDQRPAAGAGTVDFD
jgi:hypothetical protein